MSVARALSGLTCGLVFGVGLAVSQMTNPEKVLSFLRLVPGWDASLLFVMGAAVPVTFVGYRLVLRGRPLYADSYAVPTTQAIDARLLVGAALFGLGWGLAGYCPGPAIAGLGSGSSEPLVFVAALVVGGQLARLTNRPASR